MKSISHSLQIRIWLLSTILMVILMILIGGVTRLTDSGLSITTWELFVGFFPPFSDERWSEYFILYKTIPEYSQQNYNMTLDEFKVIFWWEWGHRQLGRIIGLTVLLPMIYFSIKQGIWIVKKYGIIFGMVSIIAPFGYYWSSGRGIGRYAGSWRWHRLCACLRCCVFTRWY